MHGEDLFTISIKIIILSLHTSGKTLVLHSAIYVFS